MRALAERGQGVDDAKSRRGESRLAVNRAVEVLPCRAVGEMEFIACRVMDCSLHGLALVSPQPLAVGEQFLLQIALPSGAKVMEYTVMRCGVWDAGAGGGGGYCVGARVTRFGTPSAERDLEAVMELLAGKK